MLQEWMRQASSKASGAFGQYYMKCCPDRFFFSVRHICHGTINWRPTECPSYKKWYQMLYPKQRLDDDSKFHVVCAIYLRLNAARKCSFSYALAQTCWSLKEKKGDWHWHEQSATCNRWCCRARYKRLGFVVDSWRCRGRRNYGV